jgi:hypothetical protein
MNLTLKQIFILLLRYILSMLIFLRHKIYNTLSYSPPICKGGGVEYSTCGSGPILSCVPTNATWTQILKDK